MSTDITRVSTVHSIYDDQGVDVSAGAYQICPPAETVMPLASYPVFAVLRLLDDERWTEADELKQGAQILQRMSVTKFLGLMSDLEDRQWVRRRDELEQTRGNSAKVRSYRRSAEGTSIFQHDLECYSQVESAASDEERAKLVLPSLLPV